MRFLFSFAGGLSHALPLFRIARVLTDKGHDVAFTGQLSALAVVKEAGFEAFDSGGTLTLAPAAYSAVEPFDWIRLRDRLRQNFAGFVARTRFEGVSKICEYYHPHALVCDEMDFGGMLAAESCKIPHVTSLVIASGRLATAEWVAEALNQIRADHNLKPDPKLEMIGRHLVVSSFPKELREPRIPSHPKTIYCNAFGAADASKRPKTRPSVYITFGTEFNVLAQELIATVLRGVATLDVDVIATVGRNLDPYRLGPQAENVKVERFVDQEVFLANCDLMVSHGGSGSLIGGLAYGLPMLLIPLGADQPFNAVRGQALGFAECLDPAPVSEQSVQEAVLRLLNIRQFRDVARRLQTKIHAQAPLLRAVEAIEAVATKSLQGEPTPTLQQ